MIDAYMPLGDRPSYHLTRIMAKRGLTDPSLGDLAWASEIASGDVTRETARLRVRNTRTGSWPARPKRLEAIAAALGVDPGYFYRTPAQVGEG